MIRQKCRLCMCVCQSDGLVFLMDSCGRSPLFSFMFMILYLYEHFAQHTNASRFFWTNSESLLFLIMPMSLMWLSRHFIYENEQENWAKHIFLGHFTSYWSPIRVTFVDHGMLPSSIQIASQSPPNFLIKSKTLKLYIGSGYRLGTQTRITIIFCLDSEFNSIHFGIEINKRFNFFLGQKFKIDKYRDKRENRQNST